LDFRAYVIGENAHTKRPFSGDPVQAVYEVPSQPRQFGVSSALLVGG
jgi:hypothetical protein